MLKNMRDTPYFNHTRKVGTCECGDKVFCYGFTNTCDTCGTDYNMSGQALAPRSQWGWDTSESLSDILNGSDDDY